MARAATKILVLAAAAGLSVAASLCAGPRIAHGLAGAITALQGWGGLGMALFAAAILLLTLVGIVPGALLGMAGGAVFGFAGGFLVSATGIIIGAIAAFWLGRSLLRPWLLDWLAEHPLMARLDNALAEEGWRLTALLRISPIMPFSLTSYALGASRLLFRDYALGTLASLPPLAGYVGIGALGGWGLQAPTGPAMRIHLFLAGLGIAATAVLVLYFARLSRRVFARPVSPA